MKAVIAVGRENKLSIEIAQIEPSQKDELKTLNSKLKRTDIVTRRVNGDTCVIQ